MNNEKLFTTEDHYIAAFLVSRGHDIQSVAEGDNRRTQYNFTLSQSINKDLDDYKGNAELHLYKTALVKVNKMFRDFKRAQREASRANKDCSDDYEKVVDEQ